MLELTKKTLKNVSFDPNLFQKELMKALKWLTEPADIKAFKNWCISEFGKVYPAILNQVFFKLAK
jgi:type IV secretory pathway TrbF-like protein